MASNHLGVLLLLLLTSQIISLRFLFQMVEQLQVTLQMSVILPQLITKIHLTIMLLLQVMLITILKELREHCYQIASTVVFQSRVLLTFLFKRDQNMVLLVEHHIKVE